MIKFAYPNVNNRKIFIGCGRYSLEQPTEGEYCVASPKTANLTKITTAAQVLAPEFDPMHSTIYETKDELGVRYIGESLDLAYLLSLIHTTRHLKWDSDSDIWCTGSLDFIGENRPFLNAVDQSGFNVKLEAFLSEDNPDMLFLLPQSNLQTVHAAALQVQQVRVLSVMQLSEIPQSELTTQKTIVTIRGDELSAFVELFFQPPMTPPNENDLSIRTWQHFTGEKVCTVANAPDGKTVVAGTFSNTAYCFNSQGTLRWRTSLKKAVECSAVSRDGESVVFGTWNRFPTHFSKRCIVCFAASDGSLRWQDPSKASTFDLKYSADGQTIAAAMSNELVLFDGEGTRNSLQDNSAFIPLWNVWTNAVAISADGEIVASVSGLHKHVHIMKRNGSLLGEHRSHGGAFTVAVSADGEQIAVGDHNGFVYWLDQQGNVRWQKHFADKVRAVALEKSGQYLWVGTAKKDGHLHVYDKAGRLIWQRFTGGTIYCLALSENGQRVVIGTEEGNLFLFDRDGNLLYCFSAKKQIQQVAISADAQHIVAGSLDGFVYGFHLE